MESINLIHQDLGSVPYTLTTFPDGEPHIKLSPLNRKKEYTVICRVTNPSELFVLMQVGDILNRNGVLWKLRITYLMSQRMDRVMSFEEAFSLELVTNVINSLKPFHVEVFEPHSDRAVYLINNCTPIYLSRRMRDLGTPCYPDDGAFVRYSSADEKYARTAIIMHKKRDPETGRIVSMELEDTGMKMPTRICVHDDLCDAGGTFVLAAKKLRELFPKAELNIVLAHLVNPVGLTNLAENYDHVFITDSYADWDTLSYNNVTVSPALELV